MPENVSQKIVYELRLELPRQNLPTRNPNPQPTNYQKYGRTLDVLQAHGCEIIFTSNDAKLIEISAPKEVLDSLFINGRVRASHEKSLPYIRSAWPVGFRPVRR